MSKVDDLEAVVGAVERLFRLIEKENGQVVMDGEHFKVTTLPTRGLPAPRKKKGEVKKARRPRGHGKQIMNTATNPNIWPFERGRKYNNNPVSEKVQAIVKGYLESNRQATRGELYKLVPTKVGSKAKEKDTKGRAHWDNCLGSLLRNYSRAGYLVRYKGDNGVETYKLGR